MTEDDAEHLAKLERRLDDLASSMLELRGMVRLIVDGRVTQALAPVSQRLCQASTLLDIIAGAVVAAAVAAALLYYLVVNPWPISFHIPPPHSTQEVHR